MTNNLPKSNITALYVDASDAMSLYALVEMISIHFGWFDSLQEFDIDVRYWWTETNPRVPLYVITRMQLPEPVYTFAAPTPKPLDMLANY